MPNYEKALKNHWTNTCQQLYFNQLNAILRALLSPSSIPCGTQAKNCSLPNQHQLANTGRPRPATNQVIQFSYQYAKRWPQYVTNDCSGNSDCCSTPQITYYAPSLSSVSVTIVSGRTTLYESPSLHDISSTTFSAANRTCSTCTQDKALSQFTSVRESDGISNTTV